MVLLLATIVREVVAFWGELEGVFERLILKGLSQAGQNDEMIAVTLESTRAVERVVLGLPLSRLSHWVAFHVVVLRQHRPDHVAST